MSNSGLPVPGPGIARLREDLLAASFTPDGVLDLLGAPAYAALARGETVPAERATRGDEGPLATLTRLFLLGQATPAGRVTGALPALTAEQALADGWLTPADPDGAARLRATVDIRPYAGDAGENWWIVSDQGRATAGGAGAHGQGRDVVLGAGGASTTLAQLTVRAPVARALDLGTGSGVQALHLTRHAEQVTATDLNPRALRVAALTLALSLGTGAGRGPQEAPGGVALRRGSLFEPVADDPPFDLIVSNPPFVISPAAPGSGLTYRDGGLPGDALCRTLVSSAGERLAPGGYCQLLANWEQTADQDWRERLASWVPPGCDAWIVRRQEQDVNEYAELWLRDAGAHRGDPAEYRAAYDAWLDEFASRSVRSVGFGWITLRRSGAADPSVLVEEWPHSVEQPLGAAVPAHFARRDFLRAHDDRALLTARYALAEGVTQEQLGPPGAEDPEHVVLRQRHGMMRATAMDTVSAGFAGSCDGSLAAGALLDAIAQLVDEERDTVRAAAPGWLRPLVEQGFLLPVD
ncbi:Methyltransferase small domain-containing protein [Streptomyces zhaozhouensis]|uniref:Methyltransferase small domain-containing protein n=1 Tax=Streptomyces zhaozhouensis TaxID=1300267 RepID=A0A286DWY7_9ACTN|nr:methyltransferase [Streptomyces zhaozhouensis]SOD63181.1 Methyltransferase small domain-containing protein [Streptomyces zhaozhouensis]